MKWISVFLVSGIGFLPALAQAQVAIVLRPISDTYVNSYYPDGNYGDEESLFVHAGTTTKRTYLQFDLGDIAPETVATATLRLLYGQAAPSGTLLDLHKVEEDTWDEASLTWRNMPAFEALPLGTAGVELGRTEVVWSLPTSLFVSDANGRVSLLLKLQDEELSGTATFFSKESTLPLARPAELVLTVPESKHTLLVAGCGLALWAARRRGRGWRPRRHGGWDLRGRCGGDAARPWLHDCRTSCR